MALEAHPNVCYVLKWNPRKVSRAELASKVSREGKVTKPRSGKRVGLISVKEEQEYEGKSYRFTKVIRVTERTHDRKGQLFLLPEIEVEGWWTNLKLPEEAALEKRGLARWTHGFRYQLKSTLSAWFFVPWLTTPVFLKDSQCVSKCQRFIETLY